MTINVEKLLDTNKRALVKVVVVSENSDISENRIIDASMLNFSLNVNGYIMTGNTDPKPAYRTTIKRIWGNARTNGYGVLLFEGNTNTEIATFSSGNFDYEFSHMGDAAVFVNNTEGATGDILLSTNGWSGNDALTLLVELKKDNQDYDAGQTADPTSFNYGNRGLLLG